MTVFLEYRTDNVPCVIRNVGTGINFVFVAKREVFGVFGNDGIYGPTEVVVIADKQEYPALVSADFLIQTEHDFLSIPIVLAVCATLGGAMQKEVEDQIKRLDRNSCRVSRAQEE